MKNLMLVVVCLYSFVMQGQSKTEKLLTQTEWVNSDLTYLRFDDRVVVSNFDNFRQEMSYEVDGQKLTFRVDYRVGPDPRSEMFDFKIRELRKGKLVLEPMKKLAEVENTLKKINYKPFFKKKQYVFYDRNQLRSTVNLKKITFHASTCYGICPSLSVEVDVDGVVHYQGRKNTKLFGSYTGKLSPQEMLVLRKILNRSRIYDLDAKWEQKEESKINPRYNYIIEDYKGNRVELNTNNQHPILDQLAGFFTHIEDRVEFTKTIERYKFEQSKNPKHRVLLY
ncbi:DUF6438 domain-containing protein [Flavobacteriaceae bacterium F08102]|nr:DUF6438 domain-containing protein [Flavobacteriaceae bacterium F08102]